MRPFAPPMAAMRSSHTPVGWLETREPPGSAAAFADHSGFTYTLAPEYGLSTLVPGPGGSVGSVGSVGPVESTLQVTPSSLKVAGIALEPL